MTEPAAPPPSPEAKSPLPEALTKGPPPPGTEIPAGEDRTMSMLAHLLGIFTGFLGALIIWLIKKDESVAVNDQAKEALNFQITVLIAVVVCFPLCFVLIGFLLLPIVSIANIVFCIVGTVAANNGKYYRYPVTLRLIS